MRAEINRLIAEDIIEPSYSPYPSPILAVPKKHGKVRICLDAREINKHIVNDRTSPGEIDEILKKFYGTNSSVYGTLSEAIGRLNYTHPAESTWRSYLKDGTSNSKDYPSDW